MCYLCTIIDEGRHRGQIELKMTNHRIGKPLGIGCFHSEWHIHRHLLIREDI